VSPRPRACDARVVVTAPETAQRIRQRAPEREVREQRSRVGQPTEARCAFDERGERALEGDPRLETHDDSVEEGREIRRRRRRADDAPEPERADDLERERDAQETDARSAVLIPL
jgi:hypothetical protein